MPLSRYPSGSCPCQVSLTFELHHFPAGSLFPLSRIEFVSYRLVILLRLLPTPPHDGAVAVEYGPENVCPIGTFTLLFKCAYERTRSGLFINRNSGLKNDSRSGPTRKRAGVTGGFAKNIGWRGVGVVGGVNFRQSWAWISVGSGFSGNWEKLAGVEATQDEVEEGLFGKG